MRFGLTDSVRVLVVEDEKKTASFIRKALQAGKIQLYSQILKLDPSRVLQSVTLALDAAAPAGSNACVFAMTRIVSSDRVFNQN